MSLSQLAKQAQLRSMPERNCSVQRQDFMEMVNVTLEIAKATCSWQNLKNLVHLSQEKTSSNQRKSSAVCLVSEGESSFVLPSFMDLSNVHYTSLALCRCLSKQHRGLAEDKIL